MSDTHGKYTGFVYNKITFKTPKSTFICTYKNYNNLLS